MTSTTFTHNTPHIHSQHLWHTYYDTNTHCSDLRRPPINPRQGTNNSHMTDEHWTNISHDRWTYCEHNELLMEIDKWLQVCLSRLKRILSTNSLWVPNAPERGYRQTNIGQTLVTWWTNNGQTSHVTITNTLYEPRNGQHVLLTAPHIAIPITITYHDPYSAFLYPGPYPMQP
jgi:hypothetical protein